jgi:hypothetical protein
MRRDLQAIGWDMPVGIRASVKTWAFPHQLHYALLRGCGAECETLPLESVLQLPCAMPWEQESR